MSIYEKNCPHCGADISAKIEYSAGEMCNYPDEVSFCCDECEGVVEVDLGWGVTFVEIKTPNIASTGQVATDGNLSEGTPATCRSARR